MPTGLIIAAHGSDVEPDVNEEVRQLARGVAGLGLFDEVVGAFHRGTPGYAEAVDTMTAEEIVVVPLMTSQGYYADTVLPNALATAERCAHVRMHQTSVVGRHPRIAAIVRRRYGDLVARFGLDAAGTALVLVGHGTPKHPQSRASTLACVKALKSLGTAADVLPAFLDDEPKIEVVARSLVHGAAVVIPFLIGRGVHASVDVAQRCGMNAAAMTEPPLQQGVGGRRIVLDLPIGCHTEIMDVVVDLASETIGLCRKARA